MNLMLPGNPRYQPKQLIPYFGYDNLYKPVAEVELATLDVLAEIGVIPSNDIALLTPEVREKIQNIITTNVDEVERKITKHDIRAWIRLAQEIVDPRLGRWIHVPLTSYDPLSTARTLQFVRAHRQVVQPSVKKVISIFVEKVRQTAGFVQIGRTHGQHALPVTVGFWLATILDRILRNAHEMDRYAQALEGKISGAVGAHNAQYALQFSELCGDMSFENRVLRKLDLKPAPISTQILPPEGLAYHLFSCFMLTGAFGQLGRDGRNLMRSEIAEVAEEFESGQVGSSTMAHKRNPINFENLEGMHIRTTAEFMKVQLTLISEHQRDLVGSSVGRDYSIVVINLQQQLNTLLRENKAGVPWLSRIIFSQESLERNLETSGRVILAEPMYIALQMAGYTGDAHELVNRELVPVARAENISLVDALMRRAQENEELSQVLGQIPENTRALLSRPEVYIGDAKEVAMGVASRAEEYLDSNSCY